MMELRANQEVTADNSVVLSIGQPTLNLSGVDQLKDEARDRK